GCSSILAQPSCKGSRSGEGNIGEIVSAGCFGACRCCRTIGIVDLNGSAGACFRESTYNGIAVCIPGTTCRKIITYIEKVYTSCRVQAEVGECITIEILSSESPSGWISNKIYCCRSRHTE